MKIYILECLTEDGLIENNGYFLKEENAIKEKCIQDSNPRNIRYGIEQNIIEIETED